MIMIMMMMIIIIIIIMLVILTSKLKEMLVVGSCNSRCDTTGPDNLETLNLKRKDAGCCSWASLYLPT
jgi:hypothetical protein